MNNFNNKIDSKFWSNNKIIKRYSEDIVKKIPGYNLNFDIIFKGFLQNFPTSIKNILVVGGGGGKEAELLRKNNFNQTIDIIDSSYEMIELAKYNLNNLHSTENINLLVGNFEKIKLNKKYELVFAILVLHFVKNEDKEIFMRNIYNNLSDNSICIISVMLTFENKDELKIIMDSWKNYAISNGLKEKPINAFVEGYEENIKTLTKDEYENLFTKVGFKKYINYFHALNIYSWILYK